MLLALCLRGRSVAGSGVHSGVWPGICYYTIEEDDAYFVGNLMSGMARCVEDMVLSADSDDVIRAGKTNFVDDRFEAASEAAGLILSLDAIGPNSIAPFPEWKLFA